MRRKCLGISDIYVSVLRPGCCLSVCLSAQEGGMYTPVSVDQCIHVYSPIFCGFFAVALFDRPVCTYTHCSRRAHLFPTHRGERRNILIDRYYTTGARNFRLPFCELVSFIHHHVTALFASGCASVDGRTDRMGACVWREMQYLLRAQRSQWTQDIHESVQMHTESDKGDASHKHITLSSHLSSAPWP